MAASRDRRPGDDRKSLKALAVGGHVSLNRREPVAIGDNARPLIADRPRITVGAISVGAARFRAMTGPSRCIACAGVDRTFPFAKAKAAPAFRGPGHFGKV